VTGRGGGRGQERSSKTIKLAWKVVIKPDRVLIECPVEVELEMDIF
jgi:hypothetical protein